MQQTIEQPSQQEQQASSVSISQRGWWKRKEIQKKNRHKETPLDIFDATRTEPESFYERAIEWTHRADKIINLILGYFLAVASVLGFMDVLSNGEVLGHVPFLFYIWLLIMGLGVDFQILLVIGRVPDLARMVGHPVGKWILVMFNIAFLAFLAYVSIVIGAVFTQHRDVPGTIAQAMGILGINSTNFVYERAALATFLLILMAIDRTMERWRMQIAASNRQQQQGDVQVQHEERQEQVSSASQTEQRVQTSELTQVIQAMQEMNAQNLAALHTMNDKAMQQFSQVTVELVRETIERTVATIMLPGATPQTLAVPARTSQNAHNRRQSISQEGEQQRSQERDTEAMSALEKPERGEQDMRYYGELIETMYRGNNNLTVTEIVDQVGCSRSTASKWLKRVKPVEA
ncbi:hypothetical protein [Ktedonospora formicarum]|uniref:Uncharacterized protein n=1 Tax=Ktedonospora formicarum TaxID=2778364 RepID=A0A8J3IFL2_9CHLR|nr:hypothetical protein [Ktedonospora formicarum]GHO51438.1 hypothetical protein KSX_96010 [Ktedonospora formicarum]